MRRIDCINKITTYSARFVGEVEAFNATNQYHINIHAENFLIPVLNEIFNLQLENLNSTRKKNFPAIDLADFKNRVAFQITATSTFEKIKTTLNTFFEHKMDKHFDTLYFYILTEKQPKYSDDKIKDSLLRGFNFDQKEHIIGKNKLLECINEITDTPKLELLAKLFEHEFSDAQIEIRKSEFEKGYLNNEPEELFPNMLPITFPENFYMAALNIDEEKITEKINGILEQSGKKRVKTIRKEKLIRFTLKERKCYLKDWILHDKFIYTLRNLHDTKEPLPQLIDVGTVSSPYFRATYN